MNPTKLVLMIVAFSTLALLLTACSPSTARLTADGNDAFAKQAYEEARQAYAEAQAKSPELAEPYYNAANVLYREGKYEDALKALQTAAQVAQSDALAQNSYFNAGNAAFNTQGWDAAIESYRQALLRNPDDLDAKVNLELALQQKQQQEQQDQQDEQNQEEQQQDGQPAGSAEPATAGRPRPAGSAEPGSATAGRPEPAGSAEPGSATAGRPGPAGSAAGPARSTRPAGSAGRPGWPGPG
jgi:Ca-activated chloride channel homolog